MFDALVLAKLSKMFPTEFECNFAINNRTAVSWTRSNKYITEKASQAILMSGLLLI